MKQLTVCIGSCPSFNDVMPLCSVGHRAHAIDKRYWDSDIVSHQQPAIPAFSSMRVGYALAALLLFLFGLAVLSRPFSTFPDLSCSICQCSSVTS